MKFYMSARIFSFFSVVLLAIHFASALFCPICDNPVERFIEGGVKYKRKNSMCPKCYCAERHRRLWLFLNEEKSDIFTRSLTLLHFAPESCFLNKFKNMKNLSYLPVDLYPTNSFIKKMDITDLKLANESVDVVICSHVMEHIEDDAKALSEIYRVLKPSGWVAFLFPIYWNLESTFEDGHVTDPKERFKLFDQEDHVRKYGKDFVLRFIKAGFIVEVKKLQDLSEEYRTHYGLDGYDQDWSKNALRGADIIYCRKQ